MCTSFDSEDFSSAVCYLVIRQSNINVILLRNSIGRATMTYKIFETNSSFQVKERTAGEVWFRFFKSFLLVLAKLSFSQGDWALSYHSMGFRHFPNIS